MPVNENCNCEQALALRAFLERAALLLDEARDLLNPAFTVDRGAKTASWRQKAEDWIAETNTSPFFELPVPRVVTLAQQIVDAGTTGFSREDATELAQAVLDAWITENESDDAAP